MKKQLFLGILPALLVLSACNGGGQVKERYDNLLEDTLAHEEIFDQQEQGLAPRRLLGPNVGAFRFEEPTPSTEKEEVGTPYIGVQSVTIDGKVSFRFVAAVRFESDSQRELATATWTRTVSKADGKAYPKDLSDPTPACTTAYKKLSNGDNALTIEEFNTAHNNSNYTHFVVYTLRNIDLNTYAGNDYYVSAYLTIGDMGGSPLVSKAITIKFDKSEKYIYNPSEGVYFLEGSFSGVNKQIAPSATRVDNNKAVFEYVDFSANDTFVIKEFYNARLYVHDAPEILEYDNNGKIKSCFENDGNDSIRVKASMGGSYGLYLNNSNCLYTEDGAPYYVGNGFYIKGSFNGWSSDPNYEMRTDRSNVAVLKGVSIEEGQEFKVWKNWGDNEVWYGWHDNKVSDNGEFSKADGNDNIRCNSTGKYTVYMNNEYKVWVAPYVQA